MPGFARCSWCLGKGCMCCDAERIKWEQAEAVRREKHSQRSEAEIRLSLKTLNAILVGDHSDLGASIVLCMSDGKIDPKAIKAEIAKEETCLRPFYDRQYPNGPQPILSVVTSDPKAMELLDQVIGRDAIDAAFGPNGDGIREIERRAEVAKATLAKDV